jgi:hypothetical protein
MTGLNVNHKPKAEKNAVSLVRLRILYDMTMVKSCPVSGSGMNGGEESCIRVLSSGANNSGKYTFAKIFSQ